MSELLTTTERKLWYEGVNNTADAIVIDPNTAELLLIKRRDTGDWGLPGGFIDAEDASPLDNSEKEDEDDGDDDASDGASTPASLAD